LDILEEMKDASVSVSVAFNDNIIRQQFEANTIDTEFRIEALKQLNEAGINTSALVCPVIPYITDVFPLIEMLAPYTQKIWIYGLSIQKRTDKSCRNVEDILRNHFSGRKEQVETVIFSREHSYWAQLRQDLVDLQEKRQLDLRIHL